VASGPLLVWGGRGNTGRTPHPISARARGHFRIPTCFPPRRRHSHPRAAAGNRIFRRILFYGVGIRGLLARTSFWPVESEYRVLYSRFTGQKNRGSVRHALRPSPAPPPPQTASDKRDRHAIWGRGWCCCFWRLALPIRGP
jgi:hypothetical protein